MLIPLHTMQCNVVVKQLYTRQYVLIFSIQSYTRPVYDLPFCDAFIVRMLTDGCLLHYQTDETHGAILMRYNNNNNTCRGCIVFSVA